MTGKRTALLLLASAAFGYGIHDVANIVKVKLLNRTQIISNNADHDSVLGQSSSDQFMVRVIYNGRRFEPDSISMRPGNYLFITNTSKTDLLWIESNVSGLRTSRGYAEGEQFQFIVQSEGDFLIKNKLNPAAIVTLRVQR